MTKNQSDNLTENGGRGIGCLKGLERESMKQTSSKEEK